MSVIFVLLVKKMSVVEMVWEGVRYRNLIRYLIVCKSCVSVFCVSVCDCIYYRWAKRKRSVAVSAVSGEPDNRNQIQLPLGSGYFH